MADLGAIEADVKFNDGIADSLISACRLAATAIEGQTAPRAGYVNTASTDFKGHFSELFTTNAATAAGDAAELCSRLRELAEGASKLKDEAHKEQQRREIARKWKKEHDDRNALEQFGDWISGGDDPPVGPPAAEPTIDVAPPVNRSRQTPNPGSGGGSSGTSSARPSNLRTFATGSKGANDTLRPKPAALSNHLTSFAAQCQWGKLDGSGVVTGFTKWLTANDQDVTWATTVADAFAAAGGEGEVSTVSNSALSAALQAKGVSETRSDIVIDPPLAYGTQPTSGYADDPVNTATGNFVEVEFDLGFPGVAANLVLSRCFNSFAALVANSDGPFGPGWSSAADAGLVVDDTAARLRMPDGQVMVFARLGAGWDRAAGANWWLERSEDEYRASGNDGSWWQFDAAGNWVAYGSGPSSERNIVTARRRSDGRLSGLVQSRGRSIDLIWNADRIVAALSSDGRRVDYGYDDAGRLTTVAGPLGTRRYQWAATENLITAVVDADGVTEVENDYDEQGRVSRQRSAHGRMSRYVYLPGRVTVVSDEDGSRSNTWISDERGRLIAAVDADEQRQSSAYDRFGNLVLVTERGGDSTVHEYDARGRRIRTVLPTGAELTFGYDELDRPTTVVTEQGAVTELAYEAEQRNPFSVVDPEGGATRLEWVDGLLRRLVDPTEVELRFDYDEAGDLIATTNADGQVARTERDALGRIVSATSPSGARTEYRYTDAGTLAERTDPDGAVWHFEHTAAGRLSAVVNPMGGRHTIEYGSHGEETLSVDPLGRAVSRRLDDLGNLAATTLPDGSNWQFGHDALSRVTEIIDPTGASWTRSYTADGELRASLDPTGVRVDISGSELQASITDGQSTGLAEVDPLGRLTSTGADGAAAMYSYDRCGRPVEALDADGGLTRIRRDAAGRVLETVTPMGAVTAYGYDRCGRLASVTDPLGATTTLDYDADGRPVAQTLPTGEVARTVYDACGRVVEHHRPGAGTARYVYDGCGRVVESHDPANGRRRFSYDVAGQLVSVTDGNGGITRYGYDANGRATEITTPIGGVIRREFDAMNRCVAETDPLGRTTRAGYDPAGRISWQTDPDGRTTTWSYDAAGRLQSMAVDGQTLTELQRDLRGRSIRVVDSTTDAPVEHVLQWDRNGRLVRRSRGAAALTWTYDADGRRTSMTTPDGRTTRYGCDAAGRLTSIEHPDLGRAAFDRDASGRVVSAVAGGILQAWDYADGFVVGHTVTDGSGAVRTDLTRDGAGRIASISCVDDGGETSTAYGYDGAGQLVETRSPDHRWTARYDAGGRLVAQTQDDQNTQHVYDLAGQLLETRDERGTTHYDYDGRGRRIRATDDSGVRNFGWSLSGHLASVIDRRGDRIHQIDLHTDALGELSSVDAEPVFWDTAAYAGAPVLVGTAAVLANGPITGIGQDWTAPGWRTARSTSAEQPWNTSADDTLGGVQLGAAGELTIAGLEWMGARVYDPAARGFLSVDPLESPTGAGWAANPYAYAGNDPLHAVDPHGLKPLSDQQLADYSANNGLGGWVKNNWEYVVGGAAIIAGGVLMATGVGGPLGVMLISGGADVIIQKATTGKVNWGEAAVSFGTGAFGGGMMAAKLGLQGAKAAVVAGASAGAASGGIMGGYQYATGPGPHTPGGFLTATASGAGSGAVFGGAGGAAGYQATNALRGLTSNGAAGRVLDDIAPTPSVPPEGYLYRGVHADHPGYPDALNGTAKPWGGHSDPVLHNRGDNQSEFTSWTTDQSVTDRFLAQSSQPGVVLRIPNADGPGYTRVVSPDRYNEAEVLIQGPVHGADVLR